MNLTQVTIISTTVQGMTLLSRADREIGVFPHVAPPTRLRLEFPRETGLILRCAVLSFIELDKAVVHVVRLASFL